MQCQHNGITLRFDIEIQIVSECVSADDDSDTVFIPTVRLFRLVQHPQLGFKRSKQWIVEAHENHGSLSEALASATRMAQDLPRHVERHLQAMDRANGQLSWTTMNEVFHSSDVVAGADHVELLRAWSDTLSDNDDRSPTYLHGWTESEKRRMRFEVVDGGKDAE